MTEDQVSSAYRARAAHIVPRLLAVSPSLHNRWPHYLARWDRQSEGDYIDMAEVALHLVEQLEAGDTGEFTGVFAAVEELLAGDDDVVEEVITIGLLESLQNHAATRGGSMLSGRFRSWLGERSTNRWNLLHRDWGTTDQAPTAE